jgi:hypothetical protein
VRPTRASPFSARLSDNSHSEVSGPRPTDRVIEDSRLTPNSRTLQTGYKLVGLAH